MVLYLLLFTETKNILTSFCHSILTPLVQKIPAVKTQFSRANYICSSLPDGVSEKIHIAPALKTNNYLADIVTRNTRVSHRIPSDVEEVKPAATVILHYVRHILEVIRRIMEPLNIRTCLNQIE